MRVFFVQNFDGNKMPITIHLQLQFYKKKKKGDLWSDYMDNWFRNIIFPKFHLYAPTLQVLKCQNVSYQPVISWVFWPNKYFNKTKGNCCDFLPRFTLKRNKPDNSCPSIPRVSEEILADDRDEYEFLMQASTVSLQILTFMCNIM